MDFTTFVRKPFKVEAVQITKENIEELAPLIGKILWKRENGEPFIKVNYKLIPNIPFVYLGFYMTKMGDNIRCYSQRVFEDQFVENSDSIEKWIEFLNQSKESNETTEESESEETVEVTAEGTSVS